MELNIQEFRVSADVPPSRSFEPYNLRKYSSTQLSKTDLAVKTTALNSKEDPINSNYEIINEIDNYNFNKKELKKSLKEDNFNNNNNSPSKQKIKTYKEIMRQKLGPEKSKIIKKEPNYLKNIELHKEEDKKERTDRNGITINKKNKRKVKITFIDQINKDKKLVTEIKIESFKQYNVMLGMPKEDYYHGNNRNNQDCCCCLII